MVFEVCNAPAPRNPRTEPQRRPGNGPEKDRCARQADPVRRMDLQTRETGALGQPFGERPLEGRGVSACGTLLSDAGDRALKDECPATSEELEKKCSKATSDSRRGSPNGETQTFQKPQILTIGRVKAPPPVEESAKKFRPANVLPFSVRRLKATIGPRSRRPSQTTTVENASGVRCNGWVGRPVLVCCNCTTLGTPLFREQGRPGPRRWQAIDGFRSVQRSCPSRPSNGATEASGQRPGERPFRAASRSRAADRPADARNRCPWAAFRRKTVGRARGLRVWDLTFGRGRQRPEGQTPGHLRGARRDVRRPPSIPGGSRRTERHRRFRNHRFNDREGQGTTFPLRKQQEKFRPANV